MNPLISLFITGTLTTLGVALAGLCIGMILGCLLGIAGSRKIASPLLARAIQVYVFVMQGTPLYVQLLLMCYALPLIWNGNISPLTAGIITIGMNSIAYVAQIVRGGVNGVTSGQWEAAYVLGYSQSATLWYIILPQMLRTTLPALINETISLIKETSIMGAVGIVELTKVARDTVSRTLEPQWYIIAALIYLALTGLLGMGAQALERKFDYDKGH
jgi:His/Glu/Gln/Arg/opine family amino acid ABC transporter permease subunit